MILYISEIQLNDTLQSYLRHPECDAAKRNREGVFVAMRKALDMVHHVITDGCTGGDVSPSMNVNGDSGISLAQHQPTANKAIKEFEVQLCA